MKIILKLKSNSFIFLNGLIKKIIIINQTYSMNQWLFQLTYSKFSITLKTKLILKLPIYKNKHALLQSLAPLKHDTSPKKKKH